MKYHITQIAVVVEADTPEAAVTSREGVHRLLVEPVDPETGAVNTAAGQIVEVPIDAPKPAQV